MDRRNLSNVLEQYILRFDELNEKSGNDEGYKWRAESRFKKYWDIDASDFAEMFINSMQETSNLIDNATVQPIGGIRLLLKQEKEVEFVRQSFRNLFCEDGGDLDKRQKRIDEFIDTVNARIEKYVSGSWKYPQSRNSVIYYLNLWKPEENYIFKSTEATAWANCIEYGDDFGSGKTFLLKKYYKMCDELLEEIKDNQELLKLHSIRMEKEVEGYDDKLHILVYDIIYCAHTYGFYRNMSISNTSTKERIKKAANRQKIEELNEVISNAEESLKQVQEEIEPLPNLTGEQVQHKKYGKGKVLECENGRMKIVFSEKEVTFQYPQAFVNGFLTCNEMDETVFKRNGEIEKKIENLKKEIKNAQLELQQWHSC